MTRKILLRSIAGLLFAATTACVTSTERGESVPLATTGSTGPGGGATCTLDLAPCSPTEKQYTPAETAACEAAVQASYERCVRAETCTAEVLAPALAACGTKPTNPQDVPAFEQCTIAAQDAFYACVGQGGGGTDP